MNSKPDVMFDGIILSMFDKIKELELKNKKNEEVVRLEEGDNDSKSLEGFYCLMQSANFICRMLLNMEAQKKESVLNFNEFVIFWEDKQITENIAILNSNNVINDMDFVPRVYNFICAIAKFSKPFSLGFGSTKIDFDITKVLAINKLSKSVSNKENISESLSEIPKIISEMLISKRYKDLLFEEYQLLNKMYFDLFDNENKPIPVVFPLQSQLTIYLKEYYDFIKSVYCYCEDYFTLEKLIENLINFGIKNGNVSIYNPYIGSVMASMYKEIIELNVNSYKNFKFNSTDFDYSLDELLLEGYFKRALQEFRHFHVKNGEMCLVDHFLNSSSFFSSKKVKDLDSIKKIPFSLLIEKINWSLSSLEKTTKKFRITIFGRIDDGMYEFKNFVLLLKEQNFVKEFLNSGGSIVINCFVKELTEQFSYNEGGIKAKIVKNGYDLKKASFLKNLAENNEVIFMLDNPELYTPTITVNKEYTNDGLNEYSEANLIWIYNHIVSKQCEPYNLHDQNAKLYRPIDESIIDYLEEIIEEKSCVFYLYFSSELDFEKVCKKNRDLNYEMNITDHYARVLNVAVLKLSSTQSKEEVIKSGGENKKIIFNLFEIFKNFPESVFEIEFGLQKNIFFAIDYSEFFLSYGKITISYAFDDSIPNDLKQKVIGIAKSIKNTFEVESNIKYWNGVNNKILYQTLLTILYDNARNINDLIFLASIYKNNYTRKKIDINEDEFISIKEKFDSVDPIYKKGLFYKVVKDTNYTGFNSLNAIEKERFIGSNFFEKKVEEFIGLIVEACINLELEKSLICSKTKFITGWVNRPIVRTLTRSPYWEEED